MTREELINSKEYKVVNAAFDWMEEHQDADLLDAFEAGNEWGNKQGYKDAVEKACTNLRFFFKAIDEDYDCQKFIDWFKKEMEEQQ